MDARLKPYRSVYSPAFLEAVNFVLDHEGWGKKSNHSKDFGGLTRFGISEKHHGKVPKNLGEALAIYHRDYWQKIKGEHLPFSMALATFDSAVLCGVRKAVQWLQLAINDFDVDRHLIVDGVIGPRTLQAVKQVSQMLPHRDKGYRCIVSKLIMRRRLHHIKRVRLHPDQTVWLNGWTRRCDDLTTASLGRMPTYFIDEKALFSKFRQKCYCY